MIGLERKTLLHEVLGVKIPANDPEEDDEDKEAKQRPSYGVARLPEFVSTYAAVMWRSAISVGVGGRKDVLSNTRNCSSYRRPSAGRGVRRWEEP